MTNKSLNKDISKRYRFSKSLNKECICMYLLVVVVAMIFASGFIMSGKSLLGHGDISFHLDRLQGAIDALKEGQIIPQVSPNALYGYGYGANIFYGPLPLYIIIFLKLVLGNLNTALNLYFFLSFVFSAVFMLKFMREFSNNSLLAPLASIIYISTPAFVFNAYGKAGVGEALVFCVVPLLLLGLYRLITYKKNAVCFITVAASVIILSHNISIILFGFLSLIILIVNVKSLFNKKGLKNLLLCAVFIFLITAFFTLPLLECKLSNLYPIFNQDYTSKYMGLSAERLNNQRSLIVDIFLVGESQASGCCFGVAAIPALLLSPFAIAKQKGSSAKVLLALYIGFIISIIFTTKLVNWNYIPSFLWNIQILFRFKFLAAPCIAILLTYSIITLVSCKKFTHSIVLIVIASTICFVPVQEIINVNKSEVIDIQSHMTTCERDSYNGGELGTACEYLTCAQNKADDYENVRVFVENEYHKDDRNVYVKDNLANVTWENCGSKYSIDLLSESKDNCTIVVPKLYYPGYTAVADGCVCNVACGDKGLVNIEVSNIQNSNTHIDLYYGLSTFSLIGLILSVSGLVLFIVYIVFEERRSKKKTEV